MVIPLPYVGRPVSQVNIAMIEYEEGERLVAYPDGALWADGFGHDSPDIHEGTTVTDAQAKAQLLLDLNAAAQRVIRVLGTEKVNSLTEGQWAAIVDFSYNAGVNPSEPIWSDIIHHPVLIPSDLSQRNTNRDGIVLAGLILRRDKEILMWNSTDVPTFVPPTKSEITAARAKASALNTPNV